MLFDPFKNELYKEMLDYQGDNTELWFEYVWSIIEHAGFAEYNNKSQEMLAKVRFIILCDLYNNFYNIRSGCDPDEEEEGYRYQIIEDEDDEFLLGKLCADDSAQDVDEGIDYIMSNQRNIVFDKIGCKMSIADMYNSLCLAGASDEDCEISCYEDFIRAIGIVDFVNNDYDDMNCSRAYQYLLDILPDTHPSFYNNNNNDCSFPNRSDEYYTAIRSVHIIIKVIREKYQLEDEHYDYFERIETYVEQLSNSEDTDEEFSVFSIVLQKGKETQIYAFDFSDNQLKVSNINSIYNESIGSDHVSNDIFVIDCDGIGEGYDYNELYNLEDTCLEMINCGAKISIEDDDIDKTDLDLKNS